MAGESVGRGGSWRREDGMSSFSGVKKRSRSDVVDGYSCILASSSHLKTFWMAFEQPQFVKDASSVV